MGFPSILRVTGWEVARRQDPAWITAPWEDPAEAIAHQAHSDIPGGIWWHPYLRVLAPEAMQVLVHAISGASRFITLTPSRPSTNVTASRTPMNFHSQSMVSSTRFQQAARHPSNLLRSTNTCSLLAGISSRPHCLTVSLQLKCNHIVQNRVTMRTNKVTRVGNCSVVCAAMIYRIPHI